MKIRTSSFIIIYSGALDAKILYTRHNVRPPGFMSLIGVGYFKVLNPYILYKFYIWNREYIYFLLYNHCKANKNTVR